MTTPTLGALERWLPPPGIGLPGASLDWLAAEREAARARVRAQGIPTAKQETWRYTALKGLLEQGFVHAAGPSPAVDRETIEGLSTPGLESHRLVLVNGRYAAGHSALGDLPRGLRVSSLRQALENDPDALKGHLTRVAGDGVHVFASLNGADIEDGLVVLVARGVRIERPIELLHISVGDAADGSAEPSAPHVAQPRHLIRLAEGAQATIIERYLSVGEPSYCTNALVEVALGREAGLDHYRLQVESPHAFHITGLYLSQDRASRYRGVNIGLGAAWARTDLVARFGGEGASCDLSGLYVAGDRQLLDYHLDVDHGLPGCTSRERFKGILQGQGRAVFDGRVRVARDAQKTDAQMVNNNLILSPKAEIDTKPQLEIYADDVKCSHGTTVGQLEPEKLFYLRSRGIPAVLARRILCLGFAEEIIAGLAPAALREHVTEQVGWRLEQTPFE